MSSRTRTQKNNSKIVSAVQNGEPLSRIRDLVGHSNRADIVYAYQKAVLKAINDDTYVPVKDFLESVLDNS